MQTLPTGTSAGFSLAELLVVLAIISMVVAISPTFYRMAVPSAEFSRSATELVAYLREGRLTAMRSGEAVTLRIEPVSITSTPTYVGEFSGPDDAEIIYRPEFGGGADQDVPLIFYPGGESTGGVLSLSNDGRVKEIAINWLTGHVRLVR